MIRKEYDEHVRRMLDELAEHMAAADEQREGAGSDTATATSDDSNIVVNAIGDTDAPVWSMPAVLTYEGSAARAWVVPAAQDWVHDALYDAVIIGGTLYAADAPFSPQASSLSGYFQASDTGLWLKVERGSCEFCGGVGELPWKRELTEFPEVAAEAAAADEQAWALYAEQIRSELEEG